MKYLYLVLIKCCLCINITKDVHYIKNGDHLVRHDLSSWTTQSKQEFVRINKHDLYEEIVEESYKTEKDKLRFTERSRRKDDM